MQMSLVKEQHIVLNEQIQRLNTSLGQVESELREDLDRQKNLKLEIATYFGKPRAFFGCLATPGGDGHARVYQFIKRLYSQVESLRVANAPAAGAAGQGGASQSNTAAGATRGRKDGRARVAATGGEGGTGGIR